jgi:hypothetical protein
VKAVVGTLLKAKIFRPERQLLSRKPEPRKKKNAAKEKNPFHCL